LRTYFSLFLFVILLFSCFSTDDVSTEVPDYASGVKNIIHNLEKEKIDLFEAEILVSKFLRKDNLGEKEKEEAKTFYEEIIGKINGKVEKLYNDKDYEESLKYALSLNALDRESPVQLKDIYNNLTLNMDATTDVFSKEDIKEEMADKNLLTNEEIFNFLKELAEKKSIGVFLYNLDKYSKNNESLLSDYPELNELKEKMLTLENLNIEKLMSCVVTVILDKGLNIKNGMGYIDKAIGTGFFIDGDGYILTNHHVIADHVDPEYEGYSNVYVTTKDQPEVEIPAKVVGYDKVFDIALLKIPFKSENHLVLGRSKDMSIGDRIYTIGNPLGIKYTVTTGIISNKDLGFFQLGKGFMIDAAINPGNSGGPLIDERGQVVGIVFAGVPEYEGINFAIPFEWVRKTISALYKGGEVERCWVGGALYDNNDKVFFYYTLPNGPADKSGIKPEDQLISIDGEPVKDVEDAQAKLAWRRYPMLLKLEIKRDDKIITKVVRVEKRPYLPVEEAFKRDIESNIVTLIFGIKVDYYGKGVLVKKYKTAKIYKGMYGNKLDIGEGEPVTIYDLRYMKKQKIVRLTIKYKQEEVGVIERVVTVASPVEIDSII